MPYKNPEERKRSVAEWYRRNRKRILEKTKQRKLADPEKIRLSNAKSYQKHKAARKIKLNAWQAANTEKVKAYKRKAAKKQQLINKEKIDCRRRTRTAISNGTVVKLPCEVCGATKVEAHHDDYNKPLDVKWLCRKHHVELHKTLN